MTEPLRGLRPIDLQPGSLQRLRHALRSREREGRWLPWMPLAAAVVLAFVMLTPGQRNDEVATRIIGDVLAREPEPWIELPSGTEGVRVLLARPSPNQQSGLPERPETTTR